MIRALLWILCGLILGGIVHLSTVLAMPQAAKQDAYSRLTPLTPVNTMVSLAPPTAETTIMPFMDPSFAAAVCRYDLTNGSIKLTRRSARPIRRSPSIRERASLITPSTIAPPAAAPSSSI